MKQGLDRGAIRRIASNLVRADPDFPADRFVRRATKDLGSLELKQRVERVIDVLHGTLPQPFPGAVSVLERAADGWEAGPANALSGFAAWPVIDYVGVHGLGHFDVAMQGLRRLTSLFSAEFAVRPFIEADQKRAFAFLEEWVGDSDEHVRRLVSEGTRPRLPWGARLRRLQENPRPSIRLLNRLRDDPSEYVRRSVANHMNDVAKDHPGLALDTLERWAKRAPEPRRNLIRHAARTLLKDGDARALALVGFAPDVAVEVSGLQVEPGRVSIGGSVELTFDVRSKSKSQQKLMIDYVVHHVRKNGERSEKVFKLRTLTLPAGETVGIRRKHSFARVTTREYYPGTHAVEIQINGRRRSRAEFEVS
jgi:3-methyladenine DNA glycosylase AlkC